MVFLTRDSLAGRQRGAGLYKRGNHTDSIGTVSRDGIFFNAS
jgi:hypothetical protein